MSIETYGNSAQRVPTSWVSRDPRQRWIVVTTTIATAVFAQAIFAGALLSGVAWGRAAHRATAFVLVAGVLLAALVAMATLRRIENGRRLGLGLLGLGAAACLQTGLGAISNHGANVMWLHVPLGVALVTSSMQSVVRARALGRDPTSLTATRR